MGVFLSFLVVISPVLYLAINKNIAMEKVIVVVFSCEILVLFVTGIFLGSLLPGLYLLLAVSFVCYFFVFKEMVKTKLECLKKINLPCVIYVVFILVFFTIFYKNAICIENDEFSHWADIVKVMCMFDDFGTNPLADSGFKTYPPAVSLFQYVFERINVLMGYGFEDRIIYISYMFLLFMYFIPLINTYKNKKLKYLLYCLTIFIAPSFYLSMYKNIYIDPFIGLLSGIGLSYVLCCKENDNFYHLNVYSILSILIITKDVGIVLGVVLLLVYACKEIRNKNYKHILFSIVSLFLPKLLWSYECRFVSKSFENHYNLKTIINVIIGNDTSYRREVMTNFLNRFFTLRLEPGKLRYQFLIFGILLLVVIGYSLFKKQKKTEFAIIFVGYWLYIFGLMFTYMFNFGEVEALPLASYDRYMSIEYTSLYIVMLFVTLEYLIRYSELILFGGFVVLMALPLPYNPKLVFSLIDYREFDAEHNYLITKTTLLKDIFEKEDRVFIVTEGANSYDVLFYRYHLRPAQIKGSSVYINKIYDGDSYTTIMKPEEWINDLVKNYDYVFVSNLIPNNTQYFDKSFEEVYGNLFENGECQEGALYKINKEFNILEAVDYN